MDKTALRVIIGVALGVAWAREEARKEHEAEKLEKVTKIVIEIK